MKFIVGIDEVGRGALAGPVVVAAALVPASGKGIRSRTLGVLKDSKKLTAERREAWVRHFKRGTAVSFALARVYPRGIERINISAAANVAAQRAFDRLLRDKKHARSPHVKIFLDGGLFLGNDTGAPRDMGNIKTVIKGDEKIRAVAVASIIAKVSRDRFMSRLAKRHPMYGFEVHKGYATKDHRKAIRVHGPSKAHRLTFLGSTLKLKQ